MEIATKLLAWAELSAFGERARAASKTVVWTNGCFDLLHIGHVRSLQAARRLGDLLVVGLNSDRSVRELKGPGRPLIAEAERAELLAAFACVDAVVIFDDATPERSLLQLRPDIHCKGADYGPPNGKPIPEAHAVESYGGKVAILPLVPANSTTLIVERITTLMAARKNP